MIGHPPTSILDLIEDDLSHRSTLGPDDDAAKAAWQICFMAMLPRDDDDAGDEAANQEEEYQRLCQAHILACEELSLQRQQEELDALVHMCNRVYNDLERYRLEAKRPRA